MKKYLFTLSAILMLLVAGCEMFPPDDSQIAPEAGTAPEIIISQPTADPNDTHRLRDSSFTVTIVPAAGTGFYAYLITDDSVAVDGAALLAQDYSGLYTGLVDMAEKDTLVIEANAEGGIVSGTTYYVFAVGASKSQGIASEVVCETVLTSNVNTPSPLTFSAASDGSYVEVTLNDVVKRGEGKVYYNAYYPYTGATYFTDRVEVPADSVLVSGKTVRVNTPDLPNGLIVTITWDEGAFVNSDGNNVVAFANSIYGGLDYFDQTQSYGVGILYRIPPVAWEFNYPSIALKDKDGKDSLVTTANDTIGIDCVNGGMLLVPDSTLFQYTQADYFTVTYENQDGSQLNYYTSGANSFALNADGDVVFFVDPARMPEKGTWMSISIPEGCFVDQYGNYNAEFTSNSNFIYSFGYTMNDLYGTYSTVLLSYYNGAIQSNPISIRAIADDDEDVPEGCNVVIENLLEDGTKLYAAFGKEDGLLHIPAGQELYVIEDFVMADYPEEGESEPFDASIVFYDYALAGNDVTFALTAPGVIGSVDPTWINYSSIWYTLIFDGNSFTGSLTDLIVNQLMQRQGNPAASALSAPSVSVQEGMKLYRK